jgi:hypothetical protein
MYSEVTAQIEELEKELVDLERTRRGVLKLEHNGDVVMSDMGDRSGYLWRDGSTGALSLRASFAIPLPALPVHTHTVPQITPVNTARVIGRGTAGIGAAEELTLASTAGFDLTYGAGTLNIGATTDVVRIARMGIGAAADAVNSLVLNTVPNAAANILTLNAGVVSQRTAAQILGDIGAQPVDAFLTSIAALGTAADRMIYTTGIDTAAEATLTASARTALAITAVRGDILYASGAATWARLPVGALGTILRSDGTDTAWATLATAGIQPLDADLTAIAALAGTGILCHTGVGTWAERTITSACGLTVTNPGGVAGNIDIGLTTDVVQFGRVGVGVAAPAGTLLYVYSTTADVLALIESTDNTKDITLGLTNTSSGYGLASYVYAATDDVFHLYSIGTRSYAWGIDNSDSDKMVLSTAAGPAAVPGTSNLAAWDTSGNLVNTGTVSATQFTSSIAIGTAPLVITSTTVCTNLNADLWDGYQFADYLNQAVKTTSSPTFAEVTANNYVASVAGGASYYMGAQNAQNSWRLQYVNTTSAAIQFYNAGSVYQPVQTWDDSGNSAFGGNITINDNGYIGSATGTTAIRIASTAAVTCASTLQTTDVILAYSLGHGIIRANTSDGSDNAILQFCGGGADANNRGAMVAVCGNEAASNAGSVVLTAGTAGQITMYTGAGGATLALTISATQTVTCASTLQATAVSIGTAPVAGVGLHVIGDSIFDTDGGNDPVYVTRLGATNECAAMWIDDHACYIASRQDESTTGKANLYVRVGNQAGQTDAKFAVSSYSSGADVWMLGVTTGEGIYVWGATNEEGYINLQANQGADNTDRWRFMASSSTDFVTALSFQSYQTGSWVNVWNVIDDSFRSLSIYSHTDATAANVYIDANYQLFRSTSSSRYKGNIRTLIDSEKIYDLRPVSFQSRVTERRKKITNSRNNEADLEIIPTDMLKPGRRIGLIAEEVAEVMPEMVDYDKDGKPDGVHYAMLVAPLIAEVKKLRDRIVELEKAT